MFKAIDYENWDRKEIYEAFLPCSYYITVNMNITRFLAFLKDKSYKFYPSINYVMTKVVNEHEEYRFAIENGKVGYYDMVSPLYTVLRKGNLFTNKVTDFSLDFQDFYDRFLIDVKAAEAGDKLYYENPRRSDVFCVSATHKLTFTALAFSAPLEGKSSFVPFATVGKYYNSEGKILMPLSVEFNHEINDGYHASNFFEWLQIELDNFKG